MNRRGDYDGEMRSRRVLDDTTVEALLTGRTVPSDLQPLAVVVATLRDAVAQPVPPRADLAARMAAGVFSGAAEDPSAVDAAWGRGAPGRGLPAPARPGRAGSGRAFRWGAGSGWWAARLSRPAMVGLAALAAVTGVAAGGFAGVLPNSAQEGFESVVEAVTPYEFPERRLGEAPETGPGGEGGGPGGPGLPGAPAGGESGPAADPGTETRPDDPADSGRPDDGPEIGDDPPGQGEGPPLDPGGGAPGPGSGADPPGHDDGPPNPGKGNGPPGKGSDDGPPGQGNGSGPPGRAG